MKYSVSEIREESVSLEEDCSYYDEEEEEEEMVEEECKENTQELEEPRIEIQDPQPRAPVELPLESKDLTAVNEIQESTLL